ncbi:secreted protein with altered thrombospondin repeat domain, putative [Plasmodium gallinaceum]|uniref:Secreted protein with altered thrombospondin repeat domain, putative n=1 Tax=Plasmodium gallinaceum TaxID=5849 RepID=A0A1J1GPA8_PLAGA|nr:secreted protein with altered thrombospondin repeat domain, putative [Plasmodium gallinaceum]CRG94329.1 secreted protein with altered thrombospondin repeat domain, putative [Plasmodium gallinaceum]
MKISCFLFFSIFFYFAQNITLELNRKSSRKNSLDISDENEKKKNKWLNLDPEINGNTCVIFSAKEGDLQNCWCPRGYIMCNEEDVTDIQVKLNQIKNEMERKRATPLWMQRLCDNSKDKGFKNMSVVIDYELAVICKEGSDKEHPDFEIIGASGYITKEEMQQKEKENPLYVPRKCTVNSFYLCRKVENDNVNCKYSPWSEWDTCIDKKQKRNRKVLRSNQNNNNFCLWNNKIIPRNIVEEIKSCE